MFTPPRFVVVDDKPEHISPTGGPFVLVVWTEHDHLVTHLTTYRTISTVVSTRPETVAAAGRGR